MMVGIVPGSRSIIDMLLLFIITRFVHSPSFGFVLIIIQIIFSCCFLLCFGNDNIAIAIFQDPLQKLITKHCFDYHIPECSEWAIEGQCQINPKYMNSHCPISCNVCNQIVQQLPIENKLNVINKRSYSKIQNAIGYDLGKPQMISSKNDYDNYVDIIEQARTYITDEVNVEERYKFVRTACRNKNDTCAELAIKGQCETNNENNEMSKYCGPICQSCDLLHLQTKCPLPHPNDVRNAWYPGDLNRMFERIVNDPVLSEAYNITILSRPYTDRIETTTDDDDDGGPWIITIDNFLNITEANRLIELGANVGYSRSTDSGNILEDGTFELIVTEDRTSTNAWCDTKVCNNDPIAITVYDRIEKLIKIPMSYSEEFQLLRYEKGQFYNEHHDYNEYEYDLIQGVRMLTVFLYLNTISDGGETMFPVLNNLKVKPVIGRAVIWPSVYNTQPHIMDPRTSHQALPVTGDNEIKYGANVWIHQREIIDGCA